MNLKHRNSGKGKGWAKALKKHGFTPSHLENVVSWDHNMGNEMKDDKPSAGAMRAGAMIAATEELEMLEPAWRAETMAQIIDRETGLKELVEALELARGYVPKRADYEPGSLIDKGNLDIITSALAKAKGTT